MFRSRQCCRYNNEVASVNLFVEAQENILFPKKETKIVLMTEIDTKIDVKISDLITERINSNDHKLGIPMLFQVYKDLNTLDCTNNFT